MERSESVLEPIVNITLACYTSQPNTAALDLTKQVFITSFILTELIFLPMMIS